MSAFVVSDETISAVVSGLVHHGIILPAVAQDCAEDLADANRCHVRRRYGELLSAWKGTLRLRPVVEPIELLTRLDCLTYNSDPPLWADELESLRGATLRRLPGYGDARWWR